jgi:hypothetical protein
LVPPRKRSGKFPEVVNAISDTTLPGEPEKQERDPSLIKPSPPFPDAQHHHSTDKSPYPCRGFSFGFFRINKENLNDGDE